MIHMQCTILYDIASVNMQLYSITYMYSYMYVFMPGNIIIGQYLCINYDF